MLSFFHIYMYSCLKNTQANSIFTAKISLNHRSVEEWIFMHKPGC